VIEIFKSMICNNEGLGYIYKECLIYLGFIQELNNYTKLKIHMMYSLLFSIQYKYKIE
jgi:hypothetical protein